MPFAINHKLLFKEEEIKFSFKGVIVTITIISVFLTLLGVIASLAFKGTYKSISLDYYISVPFLIGLFVNIFLESIFFYLILNLFYNIRTLALRRVNKRYVGIFCIAVISFLFKEFLQNAFPKTLGITKGGNVSFLEELLADGLIISFFCLISFCVVYIKRLRTEKKNKENDNIRLLKEKLQIENVLIETENLFLRSQINPHFLFNTLNFFYSQSYKQTPQLAEGILILSKIMRYSLYQSENIGGSVPLNDEIEHINNVIALYQMRFYNSLHIVFDVKGDTTGKLIIPMVLITLIENAFKHGDIHDANFPVKFECDVNEESRSIMFKTSNKNKTGPKELSTGIGLVNTRKRLEQLYKDRYELNVSNENDVFNVTLKLPYVVNTTSEKNIMTGQNAYV